MAQCEVCCLVPGDSSGALPFTPTTVAVVNDADYDRAVALLQTLRQTPRPTATLSSSFGLGKFLIVVILIVALITCIAIFTVRTSRDPGQSARPNKRKKPSRRSLRANR
jgi:hypothetical protein